MKHTKKWLMAGAVTAVAAMALTGCSTGDAQPGTGGGDADITVGFSVYDMQYEFFQEMEAGTKAAVEANGWKYKLHDEKSDENEMVTGAQALLDEGVDVLIISPFKPDALGPIIAKAKDLGVPVIVDDIGGGGTPYDAIVVSDNKDGGVQAADYIDAQVKALGLKSKKVVSITCEPSAVYAAQRNIGFVEQITSLGYDVVTELSGNSKAEEAYTIMKDALAKDPDIAGVFACNDPMAVAAANAITDAGKNSTTDIITVGYNGDGEALTAIDGGTLSATVAQDPRGMGELTVTLAKKLLEKGTIEFGNKAEREVYQPVTLITKDNVAEFLK
ncbi:MAG: substrate-binding domain-containing protein [Microbacteriaceae bacterium]